MLVWSGSVLGLLESETRPAFREISGRGDKVEVLSVEREIRDDPVTAHDLKGVACLVERDSGGYPVSDGYHTREIARPSGFQQVEVGNRFGFWQWQSTLRMAVPREADLALTVLEVD